MIQRWKMNGSKQNRFWYYITAVLAVISFAVLMSVWTGKKPSGETKNDTEVSLQVMDLKEYLEKSSEPWLVTGKKQYPVQGMMVSRETSFHNDLEEVDYTAEDDGVTVVLKGTVGEMWTSKLSRVLETYTKPDGSALTEEDFARKDVFIDLLSIPSPDTNYSMFVPADISVTVTTPSGAVLHTNLPSAPHGNGDYLICRMSAEGEPDLSDVWVLNGAVFSNTYDVPHAK